MKATRCGPPIRVGTAGSSAVTPSPITLTAAHGAKEATVRAACGVATRQWVARRAPMISTSRRRMASAR